MHCHYIKHKGVKVLIPGCMGTAAMGIENCTCKKNISFKQFERNEYNKQIKMNKKITIPSITEARTVKVFNQEFGTDILSRMEKLAEEFEELTQAFSDVYNGDGLGNDPERLAHLDDEIGDLYGVITHLASLRGLFQRDMLDGCLDKVVGRKKNQNYRRFNHLKGISHE